MTKISPQPIAMVVVKGATVVVVVMVNVSLSLGRTNALGKADPVFTIYPSMSFWIRRSRIVD